jgi:hypothetical protein
MIYSFGRYIVNYAMLEGNYFYFSSVFTLENSILTWIGATEELVSDSKCSGH